MFADLGLVTTAVILLVLLIGLLAFGVWIGIALLIVGFAAIFMVTPVPIGPVLATTVWSSSASWSLAALPLFIWMGEILFRTRLSEQMFLGLAPWLNWLPGRLLHVNVVGCGVFAAVSGSSAATCATIGKIALPELKKRGWKSAQEKTKWYLDQLSSKGMKVQPPGSELKSGLLKVGEQLTADWLKKAGPDGQAVVDAYRKSGS